MLSNFVLITFVVTLFLYEPIMSFTETRKTADSRSKSCVNPFEKSAAINRTSVIIITINDPVSKCLIVVVSPFYCASNAALSGVPKGHPSPVPGSPRSVAEGRTRHYRSAPHSPRSEAEGGTMLLSDRPNVAEIGFFVK